MDGNEVARNESGREGEWMGTRWMGTRFLGTKDTLVITANLLQAACVYKGNGKCLDM
jgi:hypothetical protein